MKTVNFRKLQVMFSERLQIDQGTKVIDLSAGPENLGNFCLCMLPSSLLARFLETKSNTVRQYTNI